MLALIATGGVGLSSSLGSVSGGPPSAPSLNTPGQIDPSSIERAYAALGLTYQGNQAPPQPVQQTQRAVNSMGNKTCFKYFIISIITKSTIIFRFFFHCTLPFNG